MTLRHVDFLIAGQGLAGSLLAWQLLEKGGKVMVADPGVSHTCSRIAAGMIHPVTGRRIVKSWRADEFIPFAFHTYRNIEERLGDTFLEEFPVFEIFHDIKHRNDWNARSADPGVSEYFGGECAANSVPAGVNAPFGGCWILKGGWLNTNRFIDAIGHMLKRKNCLITEPVEAGKPEFSNGRYIWGEITANVFIDCTGSSFVTSSQSTDLPFNPCKGELIKITTTGIPSDIVIHGTIHVIPIGGNHYLAGSTYDYTYADGDRTEGAHEKITAALKKMIKPSFDILEHHAAIRPSTIDRRPIIGELGTTPGHFVFNGLGSKGVMMAPWMADHLANHLLNNSPLEEEFSPQRTKGRLTTERL